MKDRFGCGHLRTPDNVEVVGKQTARCRKCRIAAKRRWRERQREITQGAVRLKPGPAPATVPANDGMSPEAYGSRRLLEAYARYYEKHVRRSAA